jgi:hypothetical protein
MMGGRDHSTIVKGWQSMERRLKWDMEMALLEYELEKFYNTTVKSISPGADDG